MIYFRVAVRLDEASSWQWRSTTLTTLNALFGFLKVYERVSKDRMRVFFSSSRKLLDEMLLCENSGRVSNSMLVEQFWQQRGKIDRSDMVRLEEELAMRKSRQLVASAAMAERSSYGLKTRPLEVLPTIIVDDRKYDAPYVFALPTSTRQALAWVRLLAKVQNGELVP